MEEIENPRTVFTELKEKVDALDDLLESYTHEAQFEHYEERLAPDAVENQIQGIEETLARLNRAYFDRKRKSEHG
jgi:hypothetical protein